FRQVLGLSLAMILSFTALFLWTHHCDALKGKNPLGIMLTSTSPGLTVWFFGTLAERLDFITWRDIYFGRAVIDAVGARWVLWLACVIVVLLRKPLRWAVPAMALYVLPFLTFPRLHAIHSYYQYANAGFCILVVAAAIDGLWEDQRHAWLP